MFLEVKIAPIDPGKMHLFNRKDLFSKCLMNALNSSVVEPSQNISCHRSSTAVSTTIAQVGGSGIFSL